MMVRAYLQKITLIKWGVGLGLLLTLSGIIQDLSATYLLRRGFYWSESILFKTPWLLFVPVAFLLHYGKEKVRLSAVQKVIAVPFLTLVHLLCTAALIALYGQLFWHSPFSFTWLFKYFLIEESVWIICLYALLLWQLKIKLAPVEARQVISDFLLLKNGKSQVKIAISKINYIQTDRPYLAIFADEKKYLHASSLAQIQAQLPLNFIRIHRSTLVNIHHVQQLKSRGNGDYDVILISAKVLRLSRRYVQQLRQQLPLLF